MALTSALVYDQENLYLVLQYANCGDLRLHLSKRSKKFSENQIKFIIKCIVEALSQLHAHNIIHRDIKPENIIFDDKGYAYLTDLGIADIVANREQKIKARTGTLGYLAPEAIMKEGESLASDFFVLGTVAYELFTQYKPYQGKSRVEFEQCMKVYQAELPECIQVSSDCRDFVNRLLQRNPMDRLGGDGNIAALREHPWLQFSAEDEVLFREMKLRAPLIPDVDQVQDSLRTRVYQPTEIKEKERAAKEELRSLKAHRVFRNYFVPWKTDSDRRRKLSSESFVSQDFANMFPTEIPQST